MQKGSGISQLKLSQDKPHILILDLNFGGSYNISSSPQPQPANRLVAYHILHFGCSTLLLLPHLPSVHKPHTSACWGITHPAPILGICFTAIELQKKKTQKQLGPLQGFCKGAHQVQGHSFTTCLIPLGLHCFRRGTEEASAPTGLCKGLWKTNGKFGAKWEAGELMAPHLLHPCSPR